MNSLRQRGSVSLLNSGKTVLGKLATLAAEATLGSISAIKTTDRVVALTFNDGPHPRYTRQLLKILKKYRARATFFMVGELACRYPEVVRSVAEAGHVIGNHSWSHPSFRLISPAQRQEQIRACQETLHPYGKRLFRPPYHHQSVASRFEALCLGYSVVGFSVHAEDWLERKSASIADQLIGQIRPGSIVVLHDNICHSTEQIPQYDRKPMLEGLRRALERIGKQFQFLTIPELLLRGSPEKRNWYSRPDPKMLDLLKRHPAVGARRYDVGVPSLDRKQI